MLDPSDCTRPCRGVVIAFSLLGATQGLLTSPAQAQCALEWQSGAGSDGPQGSVFAMVRAANGDLVAGGNFPVAGQAVVNGVARFDGTNWQAIGSGVDGPVFALAFLQNGDLVVGGLFDQAGGMPAGNIARFDGNSWSPLGAGVDNRVLDLAVLPNGDLIAAGTFAFAGTQSANGIARWDGSAWSPLGSGTGLEFTYSLTVAANGDLLAGGDAVPGVPDIVRWNGTAWVGLPGLATNSLVGVREILALGNGDLAIVADQLGFSGQRVGIWNGSQVIALPATPSPVATLAEASNGDLIAAGGLASAQTPVVARWNGNSWIALGLSAPSVIRSIVVDPAGEVFVAGQKSALVAIAAVARFQAGIWIGIGGPAPAKVNAVQRLANGEVIVAGDFASIGGVAAANIARWNGSTYVPLGLGVDGPVTGLGLANDGSLLVGGSFGAAGGAPATRVARWDGFSWSTIGSGLDLAANRLAQSANGDIVALSTTLAMSFRVFDGLSWTIVSGPLGNATDLLATPSGTVIAVGSFIELGQTPLLACAYSYGNGGFLRVPGSGNLTATTATVSPDGELVIAGSSFGQSSVFRLTSQGPQTVAAWPFNSWPKALQFLPDGDLIAVGSWVPSATATATGVARFDGLNWQGVGDGVSGGNVTDVACSDRGELFVCGTFLVAGGQVSVNLARAATDCPANVVAFGAGCTGSAGTLQLTPASQPWLGSVMTATATGFTQQSLGLHVIGLPTVPTALPFAAPGCTLQVLPVQTDLLVPNVGAVQAGFLIPNDVNLVGQQLRTQVVALELDALGNLLRLTSTNALQLTIGAF